MTLPASTKSGCYVTNLPPAGTVLNCAGRSLNLGAPRVMGVLNITPDSFSDGGQLLDGGGIARDILCQRAEHMLNAGAALLDIGGESTRPGAVAVGEQEELDRVLGALAILRPRFDTIFSVDTSTPAVMTQACRHGAGMINDVRALRRPGALEAAAATELPVCLMHMQGSPETMQCDPSYDDVTGNVCSFLRERVEACREHGISDERIVLDPGFGFGKTVEHNFKLLAELSQMVGMGYPVLAGLSRKSMIAGVLDRSVEHRMPASIGLAVIAAMKGARLIRVHDVSETFDALAMIGAMTGAMTGGLAVGATEQLDQ